MCIHCLKAIVMKMAKLPISNHILLEPWKKKPDDLLAL